MYSDTFRCITMINSCIGDCPTTHTSNFSLVGFIEWVCRFKLCTTAMDWPVYFRRDVSVVFIVQFYFWSDYFHIIDDLRLTLLECERHNLFCYLYLVYFCKKLEENQKKSAMYILQFSNSSTLFDIFHCYTIYIGLDLQCTQTYILWKYLAQWCIFNFQFYFFFTSGKWKY